MDERADLSEHRTTSVRKAGTHLGVASNRSVSRFGVPQAANAGHSHG